MPTEPTHLIAAARILDQLQVSLKVVLGRVNGVDLSSIVNGDVLDLGGDVPPNLILTVDGSDAGTGELVNVDGQRGIRVTALLIR